MTPKISLFFVLLFLIPANFSEVETDLLIIRGTIDWNLKITGGKGFKVEAESSGWKKVTFENPFKEKPSILTSFNNKKESPFYDRYVFTDKIEKDSFNFIVRNGGGTDTPDVTISFLAIGPA